jgi:DNA-binding FrmR family transcriptional regulator
MVEEGRYCPEILQQVEAAQASLGAFAETLLAGHLRHCVAGAIRSGDAARAETVYRELAALYRRSRR